MAIYMQPARSGPGSVPSVTYGLYETAAAIVIGSVLIYDTGNYDLAGADPALIAGVALQAAGTAPGYDAANSPVPITGRQQKIAVAIADRNTVFSAQLTNGSSTVVTPATTDVGSQYGITAYSGKWTVDRNKTGANARVQVIAIDLERNLVFFRWLADHIYGAT